MTHPAIARLRRLTVWRCATQPVQVIRDVHSLLTYAEQSDLCVTANLKIISTLRNEVDFLRHDSVYAYDKANALRLIKGGAA